MKKHARPVFFNFLKLEWRTPFGIIWESIGDVKMTDFQSLFNTKTTKREGTKIWKLHTVGLLRVRNFIISVILIFRTLCVSHLTFLTLYTTNRMLLQIIESRLGTGNLNEILTYRMCLRVCQKPTTQYFTCYILDPTKSGQNDPLQVFKTLLRTLKP